MPSVRVQAKTEHTEALGLDEDWSITGALDKIADGFYSRLGSDRIRRLVI